MATTYKSVDWTGGPIGPGWFMLYAPIAVDGVGSMLGTAPRYRPERTEREERPFRTKLPKEEDFAVVFMLMDDD